MTAPPSMREIFEAWWETRSFTDGKLKMLAWMGFQAGAASMAEQASKWLENAEKDYSGHFVLDAKSIIAWIRSLKP